MKDNIKTILIVFISVFAIAGFIYAANTFPTTLNDWEDGDIIESGWADSIEDKLGINSSKVKTSLDYKTTVNIELQGTASASYFLTGNTLQVGGFASAAYSRFGISTTLNSNYITGINDLLISGDLEVFGTGSFNIASASNGYFGGGLSDCATATTSKLLWTAATGKFSCGTDTDTTGATSNSLNFDEFQNPLVLDLGITITSVSFPWNWGATSFLNVGTASFSKWINVGGVAGVRIDGDGDGAITFLGLGDGSDENLTLNLDDTANTGVWSSTTGLNKLDFAAIGLELNQDVLLTLGSNTLTHDGTTFVFNDDAVFGTGAASSSFAGSLDITKGLHALDRFTVTSSASFYGGILGSGLASCSGNGNALTWFSAGAKFGCKTLADADIPDTITLTGGTIGANNISGTQTTTGTLVFGDGGDRIDFATDTWDVAAGIFSGVLGMTGTGVYDFGGATSFEIPNSAGGGTIDTTGELGMNTTSGSLNFYDGTAERVLHNFDCFTFSTDALTAKDQWGGKKFREPITIFEVSPVASGTGAVGWTL